MRWLVCVVLVVACSDPGPEPSSVVAHVTATITGTSVELWGQFSDVSQELNTSFTDGVVVRVKLGDQETQLQLYSDPWLVGHLELPSPIAGDVPITATADVAGVTSTFDGSTPSPFSVSAPVNAHASSPIVVTWSPIADDRMSWTISDACSASGPSSDVVDGDPGTLELAPALFAGQLPCDVTLDILRTRTTTAAMSPLLSSSVSVVRKESVSFDIAP